MRCEESQENLTAFLHHELSVARQGELTEHLAGCPSCQHEFDNTRAIRRLIRGMPPLEPPASFRKNLELKIENAIGRSRRNNRLEGGEPPLKAGLFPMPETLPATERNNTPGIALPSSASRALSARLEASKNETRRRVFQVKAGLTILVLFMLALLIALYVPSFRFKNGRTNFAGVNDTQKTQSGTTASARRWEERRVATMRNEVTIALIINGQVQLNDNAAENETLHVLRHCNSLTGESCLVVYRDADIRRIQADLRYDQRLFAEMLKQSLEVAAKEGKFALPEAWVRTVQGRGRDDAQMLFKVLKLDTHTEIWPATLLDKYIKDQAHVQPAEAAMPEMNGLPPE